MNRRIYSLLSEFGLNDKEISIYILLVQKNELNAYNLAKLSGIHRSTTYNVLDRLISKGFVHQLEKNDKTTYSALPIGDTIGTIRSKEIILQSLIPEIEKIHESSVSNVRVLENKDSQKQFNYNLYNQIVNKKIKWLYIISAGPTGFDDEHDKLSSKLFLRKILREINEKQLDKNIDIKLIWNDKFKDSELVNNFSKIGKSKFLKKLPTCATTVIFGDYLAYMFSIDGKPQVIEIENKLISKENEIYFSYLWNVAKY